MYRQIPNKKDLPSVGFAKEGETCIALPSPTPYHFFPDETFASLM